MKGVKIVALLLLSVLFLSCRKEEGGKELTVIFTTTTGLARHTTASHAMIYNYEWYGNVYYSTMSELMEPI